MSEVFWVIGMQWTSPLVATLAISLTIPLSLLGEKLRMGVSEGYEYFVGAFFVLVSFTLVNLVSSDWVFWVDLDKNVDEKVYSYFRCQIF